MRAWQQIIDQHPDAIQPRILIANVLVLRGITNDYTEIEYLLESRAAQEALRYLEQIENRTSGRRVGSRPIRVMSVPWSVVMILMSRPCSLRICFAL